MNFVLYYIKPAMTGTMNKPCMHVTCFSSIPYCRISEIAFLIKNNSSDLGARKSTMKGEVMNQKQDLIQLKWRAELSILMEVYNLLPIIKTPQTLKKSFT